MALEDVARFISSHRPRQMLTLLNCFYGGKGATKEDLMKHTGMTERTLCYYITKLKRWRILWTHRRRNLPAIYSIEPKAFHARIDTMLVDAVQNLIGDRPPLTPYMQDPIKPPTRWCPEATGRCHACDAITKTNSDNRCKACFEENGRASHG